jgi:hypothetical protein
MNNVGIVMGEGDEEIGRVMPFSPLTPDAARPAPLPVHVGEGQGDEG